jgi:hypothetical protein
MGRTNRVQKEKRTFDSALRFSKSRFVPSVAVVRGLARGGPKAGSASLTCAADLQVREVQ